MDDPRTAAAKLTAQFRTTFGEELKCVAVFGSVSRGESIPGVSDLNVLVLLESMALPALGRIAPLLHDWIRQGNTPPHLYSWDEWQGMPDTFAIEIADMVDARDVLWGDDPIGAESVSYRNLRAQTEREIRDLLLQLRLRLMVNATRPAEIGSLLMSGFPSVAAYMRSALRLAGLKPGLETRPVIDRVGKLISRDPSPLVRCFDARRMRRPFAVALNDPTVDEYFQFVQSILKYVDELPTKVVGTRESIAWPVHREEAER
jgi:predicted nucleotidyltransferase